MEMPKPTDAHKQLEKLAGTWVGEEKMYPSPWDPQGGTAMGRVENKTALGGFVLVQDYKQERGGRTTFEGHGIFSWDEKQKSYVLHWFDSMGMPPNEFRGGFEGGVFTLANQGPMGHSRVVFDLRQSGKYTFKMEMSSDGKTWQPMMEGGYTLKR